jgi:hypothetical protein
MIRRALAAMLLLTACGHTEVHTMMLRPPEGPAPRDPELYFEGRGPARPLYEIALVQVLGFGGDANPDDVAAALVARGKLLGCDAIVRARIDQGATRTHGFGVCVRYLSAPAPAPAPAPASPPAPASSSGTSL